MRDETFMLLPAAAREEDLEDRRMGGTGKAFELAKRRERDTRFAP
jgi:hypothetical protein